MKSEIKVGNKVNVISGAYRGESGMVKEIKSDSVAVRFDGDGYNTNVDMDCLSKDMTYKEYNKSITQKQIEEVASAVAGYSVDKSMLEEERIVAIIVKQKEIGITFSNGDSKKLFLYSTMNSDYAYTSWEEYMKAIRLFSGKDQLLRKFEEEYL